MPALLLVIAGVILKANAGWFAGAATVGAICFWVGIVIFVIWAIFALLSLSAIKSAKRRTSRW